MVLTAAPSQFHVATHAQHAGAAATTSHSKALHSSYSEQECTTVCFHVAHMQLNMNSLLLCVSVSPHTHSMQGRQPQLLTAQAPCSIEETTSIPNPLPLQPPPCQVGTGQKAYAVWIYCSNCYLVGLWLCEHISTSWGSFHCAHWSSLA